jgi:hypothetical protein
MWLVVIFFNSLVQVTYLYTSNLGGLIKQNIEVSLLVNDGEVLVVDFYHFGTLLEQFVFNARFAYRDHILSDFSTLISYSRVHLKIW